MTKVMAAVAAASALTLGAGQAFAADLDAAQISANSYTTVENLIVIADNLGRTQIALLAPAASVLPDGWVPVVTSDYATSTEQLNYLEALTQGGALLLAVPSTDHVPGAQTTLSGLSPLAAQGLAALPLAGTLASGATVYGQMAQALVLLNLINPTTTLQNGLADVTDTLGGDQVTQYAGQLTGIPSIDDALGFWTGSRTTSSWTGTTSWLGATGTTWISQDRVTMDGITSDQLKALFGANLNTPDALVVAEGSTQVVQTGTQTVVIIPAQPAVPAHQECRTVLWQQYCWTVPATPAIPAVTQEVPVYGTQWIGETDENGDQVYTTTYDPNDSVADALAALDGIDVGGFSVIQRQAGGSYTGPLGGQAGWLGAVTQVVIPGTDGAADQVLTVPLYAAGFALPDGLFTAGMQGTPGLVTTNGQSVSSVLGSRSSSISIPALNLGIEQTSLLESNYLGPDGVAINSGWTVALLNLGGTSIPLVYSLGSVNAGPYGFGFTGPSFMGLGLPGIQIGDTPPGAGQSGSIPAALSAALGNVSTSLIVLDPQLLFQLAQIEDPTGLGLTDPIGTLQSVLSPLFTEYVTPTAAQISQAIADAATEAVNTGSSQVADLSAQAVEATGDVAETTEELSAQATQQVSTQQLSTPQSLPVADEAPAARHALPEGAPSQFTPSGSDTPQHALPTTDEASSAETAPIETPSSDDSVTETPAESGSTAAVPTESTADATAETSADSTSADTGDTGETGDTSETGAADTP
ncbi:MAG: hypothetical protein QM662_17350 [Gordonia sp. (in: high G+C Gram-positive bacteria)]